MLGMDNLTEKKVTTAGSLVQAYFADLEDKKAKNIAEFRDLITFCYSDNSYLIEKKVSVSGKSVKPACYIKFSEPFDKSTFVVLDIKGKEIDLSPESARASKDIIKIFRDFEDEDIKDVKEALAEEDLSLKIEDGVYLVYPVCLEEKAKKIELK